MCSNQKPGSPSQAAGGAIPSATGGIPPWVTAMAAAVPGAAQLANRGGAGGSATSGPASSAVAAMDAGGPSTSAAAAAGLLPAPVPMPAARLAQEGNGDNGDGSGGSGGFPPAYAPAALMALAPEAQPPAKRQALGRTGQAGVYGSGGNPLGQQQNGLQQPALT